MDKEKGEKMIMVVRRESLFRGDVFQGFSKEEEIDFQKRILENFEYIKRKDAEEDTTYKQPIGYAVLVNLEEKKIFVFQRGVRDKDYAEKRLQGKWAIGVGGHIDECDNSGNDNPIKISLLREVEEEVDVKGRVGEVKVLGYVNDDKNSIGKVHFGILYLVEVKGEVFPKDNEMLKGEMMTVEEIEKIFENEDVEEWAKISLTAIKEMKIFDN